MKLLLDTHIFLWLITNDPQLSVKARLAIEDGNAVYNSLSNFQICIAIPSTACSSAKLSTMGSP